MGRAHDGSAREGNSRDDCDDASPRASSHLLQKFVQILSGTLGTLEVWKRRRGVEKRKEIRIKVFLFCHIYLLNCAC
jgi:hypothetical protein